MSAKLGLIEKAPPIEVEPQSRAKRKRTNQGGPSAKERRIQVAKYNAPTKIRIGTGQPRRYNNTGLQKLAKVKGTNANGFNETRHEFQQVLYVFLTEPNYNRD